MRFRVTAAVSTAILAALTLSPLAPTTAAAEKAATTPTRPYVTGWLPYWLPTTATDAVVGHSNLFDEASPFVFDVQSARNIDLKISSSQWQDMRSRLRGAGVDIIPTMATDLTADQFAVLLAKRSTRNAHVRTLVRLADRYNLDGIDLDYESINFGSTTAKQKVRKLYPVLARKLHRRLASDGRLLSVTVAARTSVNDPNWMVYNYQALGAAADRFRIMTYDYHWSGGSPGPMSPKWWVNDVVSFAVTQVPSRKVSFGLPAYGRDWFVKTVSGSCPSSARTTVSRSTREMEKFAQSLGKNPKWSDRGTSRTFTYTKTYSSGGSTCRAKREVWFDDARSVEEKIKLVQAHQLRGVAMWALGYESAATWGKLRTYGQTIAKRQPTLKLTTPASVAYGSKGTVSARATDAGQAVSGLAVTLSRRVTGQSTWSTVATAYTDLDGRVRFPVQPRKHVEWRVSSGPTWQLKPKVSAPSATRVSYAVAVDRGHAVLARGTRWSLTGLVQPRKLKTTVVRQKFVGGSWVEKDRQRVTDGRFSFPLRSRKSGDHVFRVIALSGSLDKGTSGPVTVRVS